MVTWRLSLGTALNRATHLSHGQALLGGVLNFHPTSRAENFKAVCSETEALGNVPCLAGELLMTLPGPPPVPPAVGPAGASHGSAPVCREGKLSCPG